MGVEAQQALDIAVQIVRSEGDKVKHSGAEVNASSVAVGADFESKVKAEDEQISHLVSGDLENETVVEDDVCLLYTSPSPRDQRGPRMPSSA